MRTWPRSTSDCRWLRENSGASATSTLSRRWPCDAASTQRLAQFDGVGRLPIIRAVFIFCGRWRHRCHHVNDGLSCSAPDRGACAGGPGPRGLQHQAQGSAAGASRARCPRRACRRVWPNCMQTPRRTWPPAPGTAPSRRWNASKAAPPAPSSRSRRSWTWPMPTGAAASARRRWRRSNASSSSTRRARRWTMRCTCAA